MRDGDFQKKMRVIQAAKEAEDLSEGGKKALGQAMKSVLRAVAKACGLRTGEFDVRYNPGGSAVKGDAVLHGEDLYVSVDPDGAGPGVLVRNCNGRKDYTGGSNGWMRWETFFGSTAPEEVARGIRSIAPAAAGGVMRGGGVAGAAPGLDPRPKREGLV